jgi:hypothetical protein
MLYPSASVTIEQTALVPDLPIPYAQLEAAAARLRPDLAPPALVKKALAECLREPRWSYRYERSQRGEEVVLQIAPSSATLRTSRTPPKPYEARAMSCTCKGSFVRGCKHPTACLIVAEALEPTTTIIGTMPQTLLRAAFDLAQTTGTPTVQLVADSGLSTCTLGAPDIASATSKLDLLTECRALLRVEQQLPMDDVERLRTALHELPPSCLTVDLEIDEGSLTLCAWDGDRVIWYDGAVLQTPLPETAPP